ncbi:MAG: LytR/AlgR family response regulator transcription factor [Blautia sp.]|jgi:DNA-binding LytR/AlgR family response regulator
MYHLIFCDDDVLQLEEVSKKVLGFCREQEGYEAEAVLCAGDRQMWEALEARKDMNTVVFMDIYMEQNKHDGICLAKQVNEKYPWIPLVFLTGYLRYASDVYEVEHCYFLLKEELDQRLPVLFHKIIPAKISNSRQYLNLYIGHKIYRVMQADIICMERNLHKTKIYMNNGQLMETAEKLSELSERLAPGEFVRCHNSIIVNLKYVRKIGRTEISLDGLEKYDKHAVSVSRSHLAMVRKRFTAWGNRNF